MLLWPEHCSPTDISGPSSSRAQSWGETGSLQFWGTWNFASTSPLCILSMWILSSGIVQCAAYTAIHSSPFLVLTSVPQPLTEHLPLVTLALILLPGDTDSQLGNYPWTLRTLLRTLYAPQPCLFPLVLVCPLDVSLIKGETNLKNQFIRSCELLLLTLYV